MFPSSSRRGYAHKNDAHGAGGTLHQSGERYRSATGKVKRKILDEVIAATGLSREIGDQGAQRAARDQEPSDSCSTLAVR
jgi:hypothetical protein